MSTLKQITTKTRNFKVNMELFDSAAEVVETCQTRAITDSSFQDMQSEHITKSWHAVGSYSEALELMRTGYQPTVDAMQGVFKANKAGTSQRFSFGNNIQGFAPIVPLALMGVPNSMMDMRMKPIKAKVIDVYYDMTSSCGTDSDEIIKAGQKLLGTIIELERQGYRFNLYAMQSYSSERRADMMVVRLKNANQPLDLKRISFPLTHTAFFRVIGFDWYSKVPNGKYLSGYGRAMQYIFSDDEITGITKELFGKTAVYFSATKINRVGNAGIIKEVTSNGNSKN